MTTLLSILYPADFFQVHSYMDRVSFLICTHLQILRLSIWWAHLDSNQGPTGYEPVALPN